MKEPRDMREMRLEIDRSELLHEISTLAYVSADMREGEQSAHSLHQAFDICEEGNIGRIDSLLELGAAVAAAAISPAAKLSYGHEEGRWTLIFRGVREEKCRLVREEVREFLVASVLEGWLSVTLPDAAIFWEKRRRESLDRLGGICGSRPGAFRRRIPPL